MNAFFVSSKIIWEIIQPAHATVWLSIVGTVLLWWNIEAAVDAGRLIITVVTTTILLTGIFSVGQWAYVFLENRFSRVELPEHADGIVVLGGLLTQQQALQEPEESAYTSRLRKGLKLMDRYPNAQLYFSGFSPQLNHRGPAEYELAKEFFELLDADLSRIHYEKRARNTFENGVYTKELANPQPGQTWLLVTSAYHMPRAIGVFRGVGWNVTAAQTGYKTSGMYNFMPNSFSFNRIMRFNNASREWIGLAAYYLTGKTSVFLPAP